MKRLLVALAVALAGGGLVGACGSDHPLPASDTVRGDSPDGSTGHRNLCATPGHEGCPCTEAGAEVECGKVEARNGEYVTCSMGRSKCDGTSWGACNGNRIVAASLPGLALGMGGLHPQATSGPCTDPCDPYTCTTVTGSTVDVNVPGVTSNDAGISLTAGTQPPGPTCTGLYCFVQKCATAGVTTTVSGTVYDPAGKNPLYNAYVYIPSDPAAPLTPFTDGASCDTCAGAGSLSVIALAQTGADGKFVLKDVPVTSGLPLIIQMGQWRRKVTLPTPQACVDNPLAPSLTHLPRNRFDGDNNKADIPKMAIASGSADPFECMLLKAGIDPAEIDVPGSGARIEYYRMNGKDRDPGGAPAGTTLTSSLAKLKTYDAVILPCEGGENQHNADAPNLVAYANAGGRVFTTHFGYVWLATPSPTGVANNMTSFYGTADWSRLNQNDYNDPTTATIDQTFPKGVAFAQWLQNIGATTTLGQQSIVQPRHDARSAYNPPSQRWMYGWDKNTATSNPADMLLAMTFNTPVGAAAASQCGRVVFSDFHVSATALSSGTCVTNADCGFGATCTPPVQGTCTDSECSTNTDCPTGFTCVGAQATGTCTPTVCATSSDCGNLNCQGTHCECTGGSQCASATCAGNCSAKSCTAATDCLSMETCSGGTSGTCQAKTCTFNFDCASNSCVAGKCQCSASGQCGSGTCAFPPTGTCAAKTCYDATQCGAAESCSGSSSGTCGVKTCTANSQCGGGTCVAGKCACTAGSQCQGGTCTPRSYNSCAIKTCNNNNQCNSSNETCTGNVCVPKACGACGAGATCIAGFCQCTANSGCGSTNCILTTVTPIGDCAASACSNATCGSTQTCTGAVAGNCQAKACTLDSQCGSGRCVSGKCTCGATTDCGSGTCNATQPGTCTASTCTPAGSGCGSVQTCTGTAPGTCAGKTCVTTADCPIGVCVGGRCDCSTNSQCGIGRSCTSRECVPKACAADLSCGSSEDCIGGVPGACTQTCTTNANCSGGALCVGGKCKGCYTDANCLPGSSYCDGGNQGGTCTPSGNFPQTCKQGNLSPQEASLEFMLFDLTACVSPDNGTPGPPPITLNPVTFTLDFNGMCQPTEKLTWREVDWQAKIPSTASIVFKAQTGNTVADFTTAQTVNVATATTSTPAAKWDTGFIPFATSSPIIPSKNILRLTVTLSPTSDKQTSPSLSQWRVLYDCSEST